MGFILTADTMGDGHTEEFHFNWQQKQQQQNNSHSDSQQTEPWLLQSIVLGS